MIDRPRIYVCGYDMTIMTPYAMLLSYKQQDIRHIGGIFFTVI